MRSTLTILLISFCLLSTAGRAHSQEIKNPALSCVFSVFLPGVGQYYNGTGDEVVKGVFQDAGVITGLVIMQNEGVNSLYGSTGLLDKPGGASTAAAVGFGLFLGSWAWSFIDAPLSADAINAQVLRSQSVPLGLPTAQAAGYDYAGKKSPLLSLFLSALIPGAGQYYNGTGLEVTKGVIQEVGTFGLIFYGTSNPSSANVILIPPIVGCYLWSVLDAPLNSDDINGKIMEEVRSGRPPLPWVKSPGDAMCLSVLLPGLGQYYNGTNDEIVKGMLQDVLFVGGLVVNGVTVSFSSQPIYGAGAVATNGPPPTDNGRIVAGLGICLGAYLWSVIDAPICADDINRKAGVPSASSHVDLHLTMLDDSASRIYPALEMSVQF